MVVEQGGHLLVRSSQGLDINREGNDYNKWTESTVVVWAGSRQFFLLYNPKAWALSQRYYQIRLHRLQTIPSSDFELNEG